MTTPITAPGQTRVTRAALVSATAAPIVLIGGWTVAAAVQPNSFDSVRDTISALAAIGTPRRELMTTALLVLGICHITTAIGLREAARIGRGILAFGGLATIGVGLSPLPETGSSTVHGVFAFAAFGALAVWPAFAWQDRVDRSWGLRPVQSNVAAVAMVVLLIVFTVSLGFGQFVGGTERVAAAAQAIWPLIVVWCAYRMQANERRGM